MLFVRVKLLHALLMDKNVNYVKIAHLIMNRNFVQMELVMMVIVFGHKLLNLLDHIVDLDNVKMSLVELKIYVHK